MEQQLGVETSGARWVSARIYLFALVVLLVFAAVLRRAHRLQLREGFRLRELAEQQYVKEIEIPPRRGTIYDRRGEPLALSVDVDSVSANPRMIGSRAAEVARRLGPILGVSPRALRGQLELPRYFVWLKRRVTPDVARSVRDAGIAGVFLQKESRRLYPNRDLAAPLLGYAGIDGRGLEGVERSLDGWLRGTPVRVLGLRDALGRPVLAEGPASAAPTGHDVTLSLDRFIQYETEEALRSVASDLDEEHGWAAAIVMDPANGEVLAMGAIPSFDANHFAESEPAHRRNRAITDAFEPGSTLKIFSVAAALEHGLARPTDVLDCEGGRFRVGRHLIHDSKPHGPLSVAQVLQVSSNIGVSKLALRLGSDRLHETLRRFGFAQPSGVSLPGERSGSLRDPRHWSKVGLANIAFGQGMTVTMMQLARALGAIGNGGILVEPRLVLDVRNAAGKSVKTYPKRSRRVMSAALSAQMLQMMQLVTQEGGTAQAAALAHYTVAGKTGTAQKVDPETGTYSKTKWLSSFIGLAPANEPRLAIVVVVNEPRGLRYHGGQVAGPIFQQIASKALRYLGVPPDREGPMLARQDVAPVRVTAKPVTRDQPASAPLAPALPQSEAKGPKLLVPDFTGMGIGEVLAAARRAGLGLEVRGSGTAVAQSPGPGTVPAGTVCRVSLKPAG